MSDVDDAIERAETPEYGLDPRPLIVEDRRILAAEVNRLRAELAATVEDVKGLTSRLADCRKGITRWGE